MVTAKPTEIEEPEPEDFVSTLPIYDLPSKREKTDLEEYDAPEKDVKPMIAKRKEEPMPDWDKMKKTPKSEKDPNQIVLGKGKKPGTALKFEIVVQSYGNDWMKCSQTFFC